MTAIRFKKQRLTLRGVTTRILNYYKASDEETRAQGMRWYQDAHDFCAKLADQTDLEVFQVAGVLSALSPMVGWDKNKENAEAFLLEGARNVHTGAQIDKAERCMTASSPLKVFKLLTKEGMKTSWFFYNIYYPNIRSGVTIDRHAIGCATMPISKVAPLPEGYTNITIGQYNFLSEAYMAAARIAGILPHQMQAITWLLWKEHRQPEPQEETEVPF